MGKNYAYLPEAVTMYTQTEALKEVKDMSENLVSGDFEREFRGRVMMDKTGLRRQTWVKGLGVAVGAIAMWLLVLTVVREVQLARLRHEVDQLSANMIAMSANIRSLNKKLSNNKMYNEFKTLEDTIYADEDQGNIPIDGTKNSEKDKQNYDSLEKLQGLTVLEDDDDLADDEDMYDGEDGDESGDWYQDYDKRREKIGTTNMVRLKSSDFTGSVVNFAEDVEKDKALLGELKRTLNDNPEGEIDMYKMFKLSASPPTTESSERSRDKRSVVSDSLAAARAVDQFAAPRVVAKLDDNKRKTKKVPSSIEVSTKAMHTVSRMVRNSDADESVQRRPFIAAHFHGNTSHLSPEIHEHYKGNGLIRVAHEAAHDVWYPSPWTIASPHPRPTLTRNGHVHVHHTGVYLVYVQIYYLDSHDIISWVLHRTNADIEGRETLLQCAQSSHSSERLEKPNSCFSAAALFLKAGDRLAVRNTGGDRHSLMQPEKSFIGLVKLADAEEPNDEF